MDRSSVIFGNKMPDKVVKKAEKAKKKFLRKYGNDTECRYPLTTQPIPGFEHLGLQNIVFGEENNLNVENPLIVGNIRMGFGHYRIALAMASCAKALGYTPLWLDLASFDATGSKVIRYQNDMYSLASRISQKSFLFNKIVWEPLNSEGFKKITYNVGDQKNSELLVPIYSGIPKDTPFIGTHVWPTQGAVHAGMTHVVNAIPDNWPMGLHLSEGSIHTIQTHFAYLGYKTLHGFDKKPLHGMSEGELKVVGHYIDHELLCDLENDNAKRAARIKAGEPYRILLTAGGAGAGADTFVKMIEHLLPRVEAGDVALFINFGDHKDMYEHVASKLPSFEANSTKYFDEYDKVQELVKRMDSEVISGIHSVYNEDIFQAVYSTNLLMPKCELMVTKPSELAYYPIPKIMIRHIGGHEVYGAIHSAELGDGTFECYKDKEILGMLDTFLRDKEITLHMLDRIVELKEQGYYDGGYNCVRLAAGIE